MRIFSDTRLSETADALLRERSTPHELVFASQLGSSVLAQGADDPALLECEIAFGQPETRSILAAPKLQWVHLSSAGYTRYDTAEFRKAAMDRGLILTNSSGVYAEACAEHVIAFMLAQSRRLPRALATRTANGTDDWTRLRNATPLLREQRVLILGYGAIATRLAAMLAPFHVELVALRRQPRGDEPVRIVTPENLDAELGYADHIVDILPDNEASRGFISAERITSMKPGAVFYNIGRGSTVDQEALATALRSGHLEAAWLDVTTPEPLPEGHPLLALPNCFITPHVAGGQRGETETLVRHFLDNLRRFEAGAPLHDRVI